MAQPFRLWRWETGHVHLTYSLTSAASLSQSGEAQILTAAMGPDHLGKRQSLGSSVATFPLESCPISFHHRLKAYSSSARAIKI